MATVISQHNHHLGLNFENFILRKTSENFTKISRKHDIIKNRV